MGVKIQDLEFWPQLLIVMPRGKAVVCYSKIEYFLMDEIVIFCPKKKVEMPKIPLILLLSETLTLYPLFNIRLCRVKTYCCTLFNNS